MWVEILCSVLPTGSFLVIISGANPTWCFWGSVIGGLCSLGAIALTLYFKKRICVQLKEKNSKDI